MVVSDGDQRAARHAAPPPADGRTRTRTLGVLVAVLVVAGVVALVMTVFGDNSNTSRAANQPSGSEVGQTGSVEPGTSSAPSTSTVPTTTAPATAATSSSAPTTATKAKTKTRTKIVKYTVKPGDNLTLIASWFNQRGYGLVYDWNKSVIGKNPNLIHPGQTIIVSLKGDTMNVSAATR